nr:beta-2-glycoprotein 1-like [Gasterosteus aculeatus aculeatus]
MERPLALILLFPFLYFPTAASDNVCLRPELADNIEKDGLQRYFSPGVELTLSCKQGYSPELGPRKIVCGISGEWTKTRLMCSPKRCPYPDSLSNGESYYEDIMFQSTINYTCNEGYTLTGNRSATCLSNGEWSTPVPQCKPVTCGLAPIPQFGKIIYDKRIRGNTTYYGLKGTYTCLPPYVLFGSARGECTVSGEWTKAPECRVVTCPAPENIDMGFLSSNEERDYDYKETVRYGCNEDYVLDGNFQIVCNQDGNWSKKPSCKAPCRVGLERARILYKEKKIWIEDLNPNRVLHNEIISFYCMDMDRQCGYAVSTQCIEGKLKIPECFEQPSAIHYKLQSSSLPSEMKQC